MIRHWYFIEESGKFGPRKYIGYAGIDTEKSRRGKGKDERETEQALEKWFVRGKDEDQRQLAADLDVLLARHGKKIKKNYVIHVGR